MLNIDQQDLMAKKWRSKSYTLFVIGIMYIYTPVNYFFKSSPYNFRVVIDDFISLCTIQDTRLKKV